MTIIVIIGVLFFIWLAFANPIRGDIGEGTVARRLKSLPYNKYIVFNDVMIKTPHGSVQIDHIVVSQYGIFVIETKNMSGFISGAEYAENWVKTQNGRKYEFFNPIRQNQSHINALRYKLDLPESKFISIIAFSTRGRLLFRELPRSVIYIPHVVGKIKCYRDIKLSVARVNDVAQQIQKIKKYKQVSNRQHVIDVASAVANKNKKIKSGICPSCGNKLVLRHGQYGDFYGCANFPKCKYTTHK